MKLVSSLSWSGTSTWLLALALALWVPGVLHAEALDSPAPFKRPDRHDEFKDPGKRLNPEDPALAGTFPEPMQARHRELMYIVLENRQDGQIHVFDAQGDWIEAGKVLSPVQKVNPGGFTASGWAEPGTVCATAVNAIHLKTQHDFKTGKSTVFSLLPIEFAEFDPKAYKSYYNATASLVTDMPAGSGIFGGEWAPLVGSKVYLGPPSWSVTDIKRGEPGLDLINSRRAAGDYVPAVGDVFIIEVARHKYNPEYIEFENRFGGLVWVKEMGLDAYPIAQVLKPVAGAGRFQGSAYAERGRIRANHPGVICISTSDKGDIGGFQIIPRDHSMSPEMTAARTKTQWMVVGPLWALDPSWEGLPPLFSDYLYPAFIPTDGKLDDGSEVSGAKVFLGRATVKARYSDAPNPQEYEVLRETRPLTFEALKDMTHLRIYFPRM